MTETVLKNIYTPLANPVRITQQHWPDGTVPLVSIRCITYNHVNFIRDAIEGFLMQETTFPVEILIHDDASTDGTAEIVREYEAQYPQLIKAIYQTVNQYSKGSSAGQFLRSLQRGKYIAACEGDDYWTDPEKLMLQIVGLEENADCALSFTLAHRVNAETREIIGTMGEHFGHRKRVISLREVVENGLASVATCSLVFNKKKLHEERYRDFFSVPRTSFFIKFVGSVGGAVFIPRPMSTYRSNVPGSHNQRTSQDVSLKLKYFYRVNDGFMELAPFLSDHDRPFASSVVVKRLIALVRDPGVPTGEKQRAVMRYKSCLNIYDIFVLSAAFARYSAALVKSRFVALGSKVG